MNLLSLLFGRASRGPKFTDLFGKYVSPERMKAIAGLKSARESFVVLYFRVPDADCEQAIPAVRDVLNTQRPDGWWFIPPTSFAVLFRSENSGVARAAGCRDAIARIEIGAASLRSTQFGQAEGDFIAAYDAHGKLAMMPMGAVSNEALKQLGPW